MSEETKNKSGRTPEQQAARDARKAAKKAAKAESGAGDNTNDNDNTEAEPSRKRRAQDDDPNLLEIDMAAGVPLSKAELRANKKRAKRGEEPLPLKKSAGEGDAEAEEKRKEKEDRPKPQPKGEYSIWVGNLSFRTTPESLKEFLTKGIVESGGDEDSITRVNMPKKADKGSFAQNKGFAYVDFKTDNIRLLALGLSERPLEGRRLLIKAGDDHKANPDARTVKALPSGPGTMGPKVLAQQKHGESPTLFIGNLPFDATEDELRDLVESNAEEQFTAPKEDEEEAEGEGEGDDDEAGEDGEDKPQTGSKRGGAKSGLIKTRLAQFEDTGRCKGFAFWDFKTSAQAKAALMNRRNHSLRGRRLTLQFASVDATKRSGAAKKKAREAEERDGTRPRRDAGGHAGGRDGGRPPKRPRYFDNENGGQAQGEGEGGDEDGGYEARSRYSGPTDYKSEKSAASRIAAMVSGEGEQSGERRSGGGGGGGGNGAGKYKWEKAGRQAPGAALAMAKREKVGIVASEGNKIKFD